MSLATTSTSGFSKLREEDLDWYNMAKRTFECTKTMMSLRVYSILRSYGSKLWDEYVTRVVDLGRNLGRLVENDPAFELATAPQCNIICFRHLVPGLSEEGLNQHNEKIREQLKLEGKYYIVKTVLRGKTYLRCTLTNAFTSLNKS